MLNRILLFLSILKFSHFIFAQSPYQPNYFGSPTQAPIVLVGNFGEIRPNHLHAGFDIKTGGREGLPIYAVADGYIARIKISPKGYGKALYINHPNGYTSVYAHLQSFNGVIGTTAKGIQYGLESFEIDTILKPNALPVKKGEQIALSGNTGGKNRGSYQSIFFWILS
jgi:murein DD-endopeptidase MepM/ murein hydrolase activator NlpD